MSKALLCKEMQIDYWINLSNFRKGKANMIKKKNRTCDICSLFFATENVNKFSDFKI